MQCANTIQFTYVKRFHANRAALVYQSFKLLLTIIHYCTPIQKAHMHTSIINAYNRLKMRYD